jgi:hypothetical protein
MAGIFALFCKPPSTAGFLRTVRHDNPFLAILRSLPPTGHLQFSVARARLQRRAPKASRVSLSPPSTKLQPDAFGGAKGIYRQEPGAINAGRGVSVRCCASESVAPGSPDTGVVIIANSQLSNDCGPLTSTVSRKKPSVACRPSRCK